MKMQADREMNEPLKQIWIKRITWALPLFFLAKGLIWLSLPLFLAVYGLN